MMNQKTIRQKGFYITSKLYELAAEFSNEELKKIITDQRSIKSSPSVISALEAINALHGNAEANFESIPKITENFKKIVQKPERRIDLLIPRTAAGSAEEIKKDEISKIIKTLTNRTKFPQIKDVANLIEFPSKYKEARERYLNRLSSHLQGLSDSERGLLIDRINKIFLKEDNDFIKNWSKLIKNL